MSKEDNEFEGGGGGECGLWRESTNSGCGAAVFSSRFTFLIDSPTRFFHETKRHPSSFIARLSIFSPDHHCIGPINQSQSDENPTQFLNFHDFISGIYFPLFFFLSTCGGFDFSLISPPPPPPDAAGTYCLLFPSPHPILVFGGS